MVCLFRGHPRTLFLSRLSWAHSLPPFHRTPFYTPPPSCCSCCYCFCFLHEIRWRLEKSKVPFWFFFIPLFFLSFGVVCFFLLLRGVVSDCISPCTAHVLSLLLSCMTAIGHVILLSRLPFPFISFFCPLWSSFACIRKKQWALLLLSLPLPQGWKREGGGLRAQEKRTDERERANRYLRRTSKY